MESEEGEKSGKEGAEKQQLWAIKLKRGVLVGKRAGPTTPPPTWKLHDEDEQHPLHHQTSSSPRVSARKLGANLWEIQQQSHHAHQVFDKMSKGGERMRNYRERGARIAARLADPPHTPLHQVLTIGFGKFTILLYCTTSKVAAYYPPSTPSSSLDSRGRLGDSSHNLKTSTEFLKVLNRIWSLEEQHASNVSLVKALKIELDNARSQVKELLQEQQADRNEIDDLMKQIAEDKLFRKSKENNRIKTALQSVRDELEDERKLRRRSESLHRKLARELSEVKSAFSKALKEIERERKARTLLEELCDEFAKGIGDYEQEVRSLRHKSEKDHGGRDDQDRLIVHISEAWLDERLQMKHAEARCDVAEKNTIVDKLSFEIETFLKAKRSSNLDSNNFSPVRDSKKNSNLRRHSLESFPLQGVASAPQDADDDGDSLSSDSHCFELVNQTVGDKTTNGVSKTTPRELGEETEEENGFIEARKSNFVKKKLGTVERIKGHSASMSQTQFDELLDRAMSGADKRTHLLNMDEKERQEINPVEVSLPRKSEIYEATNRRAKRDETHGSNSNNIVDDLIKRSQMLLADSGRKLVHTADAGGEDSHPWRGIASPVQQWVSRFAAPDLEISESSSQWEPSVKGNTLKARLMEARLEGQHSRLKASKG